MTKRNSGTVKWFNPEKGFGFIKPEGGGADIFVHISAVEGAGFKTLMPDQRIEFELEERRGKVAAVKLKRAV